MSWVAPEAPPLFIAHGTNDTLVRSNTQHASDVFSSVRTLHTLRAIDRLLAVVRSRAESVAPPRGSFLAV